MFINKNFKSLLDLLEAFPTEQSCIDHLTELRWEGNVPESPFSEHSKVYVCKGNKYKCKDSGKYFNVKTGTIFEDTKIPLRKWMIAVYLVTNHKKSISSYQLAEDIGVTQKTAWFMAQRIMHGLGISNDSDTDLMEGTVEADETFVGGKNKNRHKDKKVKSSQGRSFKDKTPVLGLLQREETETVYRPHKVIKGRTVKEKVIVKESKLRAFVVPDTKRKSIQPIIYDNVKEGTRLMSDEWSAYAGLNSHYDHNIIDHSKKEYVNLDDNTIHTNTIEGAWSHLKRKIIGIHHVVSRKHLQKYVDGFVFNYNNRLKSNAEKVDALLLSCRTYSRLTYKNLVNGI